ncbi:matrixin family metalloprotease [Myxococcota bacterium]|nr:matrixin family metalloprotease [Myxococcota bacterium]
MALAPRLRLAVLMVWGLWAGCAKAPFLAESRDVYTPDRRDYAAFRAGNDGLLEPNYLPFMAHRFTGAGPEGDVLVLCRWEASDMPLAVFIPTPVIPDSLQNEFAPRSADVYVRAAEEAFEMWEGELEGLVRFERVPSAEQARLKVQLVPEEARDWHDVTPLGSVRLRGACRPQAFDENADRLEVTFEVGELRVFMADEFGLFTPEQVKWIVLHEIGHALGMRNHSPIPADLMYERLRDRVLVPGLSIEDVNSFVSLYQLPNGSILARVPRGSSGRMSPAPPPTGSPQLAGAPHVDARLGYSLRPPRGWTRLETRRGMVAIDGVAWDNSASFQVIVERYDTIEEYMERYADHYLSRGRLLAFGSREVAGYPAVHAFIQSAVGERVEEVTLVEVGDGRVLVLIADSSAADAVSYRPWFDATRKSLRIWGFGGEAD